MNRKKLLSLAFGVSILVQSLNVINVQAISAQTNKEVLIDKQIVNNSSQTVEVMNKKEFVKLISESRNISMEEALNYVNKIVGYNRITTKSIDVIGTENPDGGFSRTRVYARVIKTMTVGSGNFSTKVKVTVPVTIMRRRTPGGTYQSFEKVLKGDAFCTIVNNSHAEITTSKLRISNTSNKVVIDGDIVLTATYDKSTTQGGSLEVAIEKEDVGSLTGGYEYSHTSGNKLYITADKAFLHKEILPTRY
ncbi:hypothetical protein [Clostridium sp. ZS2-4]|uniref:hypothetical protein n=1 Tax=Clostridium sp. ZS2-4 TaxID=2987703 RepID=UPI00227ABDE3|nr:hypothetical protein [Clostridium sp. ZS2-4]MCY6355981.1 hypothetical protein [Clostridium sp. ZS2-4]